jgi:hypothetical protein
MKKSLLLILLFSYTHLFSQTNCTDFKLTDFKINGNTTITSNEATLTQAIGSQGGSIWSNQKIDLSKDFTISTELNFGTNDGSGADGIAFVLQPLSSDLGGSGGGLGYQGISPSLGVEFDTWYNSGVDPLTEDHIAIIKNGHPESITAHSEFIPAIALPNIEDGLWHNAVFEWNATTKKLKLTFDTIVRFDTSIDIVNSIFSGNPIVYWGFTAATGAAVNIQKVKLKNYCVTLETCSNIPEIIASKTSICKGETTQLSINSQTPATAIFSATQTFRAPWNINWPVTAGKNYVLKVSGTYGITSSSGIDVDAAYNLITNQRYNQTCSGYQDRWKLIDNCPARPTPDNYNSQHIYNYTILNSDGSVDINYSDSLYSDNSGSLNFELYNFVSYLWSTGETTASISPTPTTTTNYWVDVTVNGVTCRKEITIIVTTVATPTGLPTQSFCSSATIADLVASGTSIKWYDTATGGNVIANTTELLNGKTYYAASVINSCESLARLAITTTIQNIPEITSSNTTICANQSVQLGIVYTPPTICNMNITPSSIPLGNPIPGFTYGGLYNGHYYYIYNTPTTWTAGELISRQNGGYLVCINDINENQFVSNLTNNNIWIGLFRDPTTCQFRWLDCMDITFTNWRPGEPNSDPCDEPYTQIIRGCSFGLNTWNNLNDVSTNGSCYSDMVPIMEIDPSIYNTSPINTTTTYLWSTGETTSSINPTPRVTTTYWVDVTTNGATCRKSIIITIKNTPAPTGAAKQQFCNDTTIAALAVNGIAVKWYATATGTTALNNTTSLVNGTTYFATQTIDGCESTNRFQTTVGVIKIPAPTGDGIQKFCLEGNPVISDLIVTGNSIVWFDALTNGMMLDNATLLQDNTTYFATTLDTSTGCESSQRLAVKVDLFKCNITAYNLITINGNSLNDQLTFEDISYFPDNSVKIYNRYGKLVWETSGYDNTNNAFKGKANVSGVYMKDSFLPAGTYFYILVYNNTYIGKQTELTGYLQIDNAN